MGMDAQTEIISTGSQVELNLINRAGNKDRLKVVIVTDDAADFTHGLLSENTPIAKALLGERAGNTIPYLKGDILAIEILSVSKPAQMPTEEAAEKRKEQMKQAMREVEDTNAIVFASSFSGKWGDYDPDSIPKEKKPEDKD
jgi:hypothetical protein